MNYANALMKKAKFKEAEHYFLEAQKIRPNSRVLEINFGVLYGALNNDKKAESHYLRAINLNSRYQSLAPDPDFYYARYLAGKGKYRLAKEHLNNSLKISPNHLQSIQLLKSLMTWLRYLLEKIQILQGL